MTLKKAQKMFLVTPHQLNRLTRPSQSIRDVAEDDLDARMRAILNEQGLSSHEKIKKYNALLQRYLTFVKQDQTENLTENLTKTEAEADSGTDVRTSDSIIDDVLQSLPPRDRKNAEYVLKKLSDRHDVWNTKGEFVYRGNVVKGSHMIDLFKRLLFPFKKKKSEGSEPPGWTHFLNTLSELNIPLSSISNPKARNQYRLLKMDAIGSQDSETPADLPSKTRRRTNDPPRWINISS